MRAPRFLAAFLLLLLAAPALALYTVHQIASPGRPVPPEHAAARSWPEGALALVNHARRTIGWAGYWSGCPNDVEHYGFDLKAPDDPQALIDLLARIQLPPRSADRALVLVLELGRSRKVPFPGAQTVDAELALGAQAVLDRWFERLPNGQFGVHKLAKPPTALAPMLTLYIDHEAVDLARLKVPLSVQIVDGPHVKDALTPAEKASAAAVARFIAAHRARQQAAAATQPATRPR